MKYLLSVLFVLCAACSDSCDCGAPWTHSDAGAAGQGAAGSDADAGADDSDGGK